MTVLEYSGHGPNSVSNDSINIAESYSYLEGKLSMMDNQTFLSKYSGVDSYRSVIRVHQNTSVAGLPKYFVKKNVFKGKSKVRTILFRACLKMIVAQTFYLTYKMNISIEHEYKY